MKNVENIKETIVNALCLRLYNVFNVGCVTTVSKIEYPCFYISQVADVSFDKDLKDLYWNKYTFDIKYFDNDTDVEVDEDKLSRIAQQLFLSTELLHLGETGVLIRGHDTTWRVTDGVLHFFITYDVRVLLQREKAPVMEDLIVKEE